MTDPLSFKDKLLSFYAVVFLTLSGASIAQAGRLPQPFCAKSTPTALPVPIVPAIAVSTLTTTTDNSSRYIHTQKNSDLVIHIPDAVSGSYKLIFFEEDHFLFEMNVPKESYLIMEKNNFRHAGLFRYELFRAYTLVETNNFIIKND